MARSPSPHASPHWLPAVRFAVGETVFDEALAQLTILHGDDPSYRIERVHLANTVQVAWSAMRKGWQRAERVVSSGSYLMRGFS